MENSRAFLSEINGKIEEIRKQAVLDYTAMRKHATLLFTRKKPELNKEDEEKAKEQIDIRLRALLAPRLRHEVDLACIRVAESHKEKIRRALLTLTKKKAAPPKGLSAYLSHALFDDYDQENTRMLEWNPAQIERLKAELEKWEESWKSNRFDYRPPKFERGRFRFDYDNAPQATESLKQLLAPMQPPPEPSTAKTSK